MKERLLTWFTDRNLNAMNFLQDHGLVSDNAITIDDVDDSDIRLCNYFILSGEMDELLKDYEPKKTK